MESQTEGRARLAQRLGKGWPDKELAAAKGLCNIESMDKILFPALILCLLLIPVALPAAPEESDSASVRALEVQLMEAYKKRQFDSLASLLDDDFVITFEDGSTYGKTGYISFSAASSVRIDVAEMSDVKSECGETPQC